MNNQKAKQLRREAEQYAAAYEITYKVREPCGSFQLPYLDSVGNTHYKSFPKNRHGGTLVMGVCTRAVYKGLKQNYNRGGE